MTFEQLNKSTNMLNWGRYISNQRPRTCILLGKSQVWGPLLKKNKTKNNEAHRQHYLPFLQVYYWYIKRYCYAITFDKLRFKISNTLIQQYSRKYETPSQMNMIIESLLFITRDWKYEKVLICFEMSVSCTWEVLQILKALLREILQLKGGSCDNYS